MQNTSIPLLAHSRHDAPYLPFGDLQVMGSLLLRNRSLFRLAKHFQSIAAPRR